VCEYVANQLGVDTATIICNTLVKNGVELSFHVINNFFFDIMHDIFEGECKYDICHILISLINKGIITLNEINSRKSLFPYGEKEVGNSSVKIEMNRLKTCNLKSLQAKQNVFPTSCP